MFGSSTPRSPFNAENVTASEKISFVVTMRYTNWLIRSFMESLFELTQYANWWNEDSDDVRELGRSYGTELYNMVREYDRVGQISAYCVSDNSELPDDILPCDGSTYPKNDYPDLWQALPLALKDDDTFATPDLRGHVIGGAGDYPLLTSRAVLDRAGAENHVLVESEMPVHSHVDLGHIHSTHGHLTGLAIAPGELPVSLPSVIPDATSTGNAAIQNAGGGLGHSSIQPTVFLIYGIVAK